MVKHTLAVGFLFFLLVGKQSFASSCCGSSQANSALILSEQKIVLRTSMSETRGIGRVFNEQGFHDWGDEKKRRGRALGLSASFAVSGLDQIGVTTNLVLSSYQDEFGHQSSEDFGDFALNYARKVKTSLFDIFFSLNSIIPTGKSPYEGGLLSENANVTGFGQYGLGLGLSAYKFKFPFTSLLSLRVENYFKDRINKISLSNLEVLRATSFFGYSFGEGYGLGGGFSFFYINSHRVNSFKVPAANTTSLDISFSKSVDTRAIVTLMYSDQTLIGSSRNSILNRSVTLNYLYNFF